ncbi:MAG: S24/S26 family peptidase [Prevotellaceae bacterium]|jgi:signal peptidase I|nr:S24/S26 family peptidase [Prevotellaceae bacterium]
MKIIDNELFFSEIEKIISAGENVSITVKGRSMMPLLHNRRDAVVLAPVDTKTLAVGQIVLFRYNERHLLHRIVKIDGDNIVIQGDGTRSAENATRADIVAVAVAIIRKNRKKTMLPNRWENLYFRLWLLLKPFRRYLLAIHRRLPKLKIR